MNPTQGVDGSNSSVDGGFPSIKNLLTTSFSLYRDRFGTIFWITTLPLIILGVLLFFGPQIASSNLIGSYLGDRWFGVFTSITNIVLLLGLIPATLFYYLGWFGLIYVLSEKDKDIGIVEGFRRAIPNFWSYIFISIIVYAISVFGTIFFIIPGVVFSVWFLFSSFILVEDGIKGVDSLLVSRQYASGLVKKVFLRLMVVGILSLLAYLLIFVLNLYFFEPYFNQYVQLLVFWLIFIVISQFQYVYLFVLYKQVRGVKGDLVNTATKKQKNILRIGVVLGVFVVVFVFVGIMLMNLRSPVLAALDLKKKDDLSMIQDALEYYYDENGSYPNSLHGLAPIYLLDVPVDPKTKLFYKYELMYDGSDYELCAKMEVTKEDYCVSYGAAE